MRNVLSVLFAAAAVVTAGPSAIAQDHSAQCNDRSTAVPGSHQEFCFGDELVGGTLLRPDESSTHVLRQAHGISLIRLRPHFVPELLKSAENL